VDVGMEERRSRGEHDGDGPGGTRAAFQTQSHRPANPQVRQQSRRLGRSTPYDEAAKQGQILSASLTGTQGL
jgi:hypothetical protein